MIPILTDQEVQHNCTAAEAVAVMEAVFIARANRHVFSVPRWELPFPEGRLTFTVGAVPDGVGFRAYIRGHYEHDDQLVAVWDRQTGALKGLIVGEALGILRTGAIGGVAIKHMTRPDVSTLALIGSGRQNLSQLLAIAAVRPVTTVRVYSRTPENRNGFCQNATLWLPNVAISPVDSAEEAVRGAEIVVSATTSKTPLIRGEWLMEGAHVSTLGTKGRAAREVDDEVVKRATWVVSDTPEQSRNYPDGTILDGTDHQLHDLAEVVVGKVQRPVGISLFMSAGLAGTEVALAAHLLEKHRTI